MSLVAFKRRAEATKSQDETFDRLDLRSMKAFGASWKNCTFLSCRLDLADLRGGKFEDCVFRNCSMQLANVSTAFIERCAFHSCNMEQSSFMGSYFLDTEFNDCRMAYGETLFQDATVKGGLLLKDCNLHGSSLDFREVQPGALTLDGCNCWGAKISLGCAVFNGTVDERTERQVLALVARLRHNPQVAALAADQMAVVDRLMRDQKE